MGEASRRARLVGQRLVPRHGGSVAELVRALGGVQAQDATAAALALRARIAELAGRDVERALHEERSVVRTWAMRGTLHLLAAEDARWVIGLLGSRFVAGNRRRRAELGLDEDASERGLDTIRRALAWRGPLTRPEVAEELARADLAHRGQATVHLLFKAALEGHVCFGPPRGGAETFVLLDDWLPPAPAAPTDPVAELARRYRAAHALAAAEDFAHWAGLSLAEARAGWRDAGEPPEVHELAAPQTTRLLGAFDEYLLGWRDRSFAVSAEHARAVHPGGGMIRPTLLVDGRTVATWRRPGGRVVLEPFADVPSAADASLRQELADVERFLG